MNVKVKIHRHQETGRTKQKCLEDLDRIWFKRFEVDSLTEMRREINSLLFFVDNALWWEVINAPDIWMNIQFWNDIFFFNLLNICSRCLCIYVTYLGKSFSSTSPMCLSLGRSGYHPLRFNLTHCHKCHCLGAEMCRVMIHWLLE